MGTDRRMVSSESDSSASESSDSEPEEVRVPIGQLLKKRKRSEPEVKKELTIDEQIAALEAEMESSDDSDSDEDEEEKASGKDKSEMVFRTELTEEDLIPALPAACLPANIAEERAQRKRHKKQMKNTGSGVCYCMMVRLRYCVCGSGLRDAVADIMRTAGMKAGKDEGVREMVAGYEPNSHKSMYCRACKFTADTKDALMEHRNTTEHKVNSQ